jgi:hypothetical protein
MKKASLLSALVLPLLLLFAWLSAPVVAGHVPTEIITVTTTDPAAAPGDEQCSLIEAIDNANSDSDTSAGDCPAGNGADEIVLGVASTYTLIAVHSYAEGDNGLPAIVSPVTVSGQGSTIERDGTGDAPAFRIFYIGSGGDLALNDVTIRNGLSSAGFSGGGIRNQGGTLTVNGSTVRDNEAADASGGGIYTLATGTDATTTVNNSQVLSNTAGISGGGLMVVGNSQVTATLTVSGSLISLNLANETAGGIRSTRSAGSSDYSVHVNVLASEISHNTTLNSVGFVGGGGLVINYTTLFLADSDVSHNVAETGSAFGGGLVSSFAEITILGSTIRDNLAASGAGPLPPGGGGILNCDGPMTIVNSTIAGNQATGGASGGAILAMNCFGTSPSIVTLINSTISGNSADTMAGAVATMDSGTGQPVAVNFVNTIVADNPAPDANNCVAAPGTTIASLGYNLEDDDTCHFDQPGDQVNTDPLLGPLQANGGPTWTHALLEGSPAIDAADDAVCAAPPVNGVDQRGVTRPQGAACDVGAFEAEELAAAYHLYLPVGMTP